jgi:hypothetical protein
MDPIDPASATPHDVEYGFNRPVCLGWAAFSVSLVVACVVLVAAAGGEMFVRGLVPGWLFGSFGAVLFTAMGFSWVGRFLHSGAALTLNESGITADKRLGGIATPTIDRTILWEEVEWASTGPHGGVVLQLRDPDAFWARQGWLSRILAWHPGRTRRNLVSLGGHDLAAPASEVASVIQAHSNWIGLEGSGNRPRLTADLDHDEELR